jgi:hypothetical protein
MHAMPARLFGGGYDGFVSVWPREGRIFGTNVSSASIRLMQKTYLLWPWPRPINRLVAMHRSPQNLIPEMEP